MIRKLAIILLLIPVLIIGCSQTNSNYIQDDKKAPGLEETNSNSSNDDLKSRALNYFLESRNGHSAEIVDSFLLDHDDPLAALVVFYRDIEQNTNANIAVVDYGNTSIRGVGIDTNNSYRFVDPVNFNIAYNDLNHPEIMVELINTKTNVIENFYVTIGPNYISVSEEHNTLPNVPAPK